jgi:lysophospholipase L1-like esterase
VLDRQLPVLESLHQEPSLVTVMIGSNDLFSPELRRHPAADMATLLRRLPRGTVVSNLPQPQQAAVEVDALIDEAVADHGLVLAEFRTPAMRSWKGRLAADRFHPNDEGYRGIADVFDAVTG